MINEDKKKLGLFDKFTVTRNDGQGEPGGKHYGCPYFVLDMTHDPFAVPALNAYADACEQEGYYNLADELRRYALMNIGSSLDLSGETPE